MTVAVVALAVVAAAALAFAANASAVLSHFVDVFREEQRAWTVERRELLNRVQRPEVTPFTPVEAFAYPEAEADGIEEVGTVKFDDEALLQELG